MKAKKILADACAVVMLAVAAIPNVSAADAVKGSISKTEAKAGEKFSVTLDLADIPAAGINACDFGISYNSQVITVTDVKLGDLAKEEDNAALSEVNALETNIEEDLVSIIYGLGSTDSTKYMKGTGTFLEISGTVNKTAVEGSKSELNVVAVDRLATSTGTAPNKDVIFGVLADDNETYTIYNATITSGLVTVIGEGSTQGTTDPSEVPTPPTEPPTTVVSQPPTTEPEVEVTLGDFEGDATVLMYGDVNLSEEIDSGDIAKLVKYKLDAKEYALGDGAGTATEAQALEQADVAYDRVINTSDIIKLTSCLLGNIKESELGPK